LPRVTAKNGNGASFLSQGHIKVILSSDNITESISVYEKSLFPSPKKGFHSNTYFPSLETETLSSRFGEKPSLCFSLFKISVCISSNAGKNLLTFFRVPPWIITSVSSRRGK
jgi:hypothetical protein